MIDSLSNVLLISDRLYLNLRSHNLGKDLFSSNQSLRNILKITPQGATSGEIQFSNIVTGLYQSYSPSFMRLENFEATHLERN